MMDCFKDSELAPKPGIIWASLVSGAAGTSAKHSRLACLRGWRGRTRPSIMVAAAMGTDKSPDDSMIGRGARVGGRVGWAMQGPGIDEVGTSADWAGSAAPEGLRV